MQLERQVISHLSSPDYVPQDLDGLATALGLAGGEQRKLRRVITKLLDDGVVARVKRDRYVLPSDADLISGEIKFRASGSALLWPEAKGGAAPEPFTVRSEDTHTAMHGDKVLARLVEEEHRFESRQRREREQRRPAMPRLARVIRILQRGRETLTGTLQRTRMFYYVVPDDPRFPQDVLVPPPEQSAFFPKPKEGDKVVVRLHEWKQRHLNPEGELVEVLGQTHEPMAEFKALLHNYKLTPDFPREVTEQVLEVEPRVPAKAIKGRQDIRKILTFTIDPTDAKDFDDALSIETVPEGFRVGVHIADVSAYVKYQTPLDKEARRRGNSTYLVGTVIPMLPHALSNGICSLVEGEDRLTKSVFLTFTPDAKLLKTDFANTVIRSAKRCTYHQALALLKDDDLAGVRAVPLPPSHQTGSTGRDFAEVPDTELRALQKATRDLWHLARQLRATRMSTGSLDFDMPETKIFVDENGYAERLEVIEYDESHQLIEEFMLSANEAVARALHGARLPYISRVHDDPDPTKLNELREEMLLNGLNCGDLTQRVEVNGLLTQIKAHPQGELLRIKFLRSLRQACYRAEADGHYGLNKQFYAHFTSPIRRYADLSVHRQFDVWLARERNPTAPARPAKPYSKEELDELATHITRTEQNSTEAERESVKIKLLEFFERQLSRPEKEAFEATITDVRNHGFFIELSQSGAFGMIHISTLRDDIYRLSEDRSSLEGRRHQRRFTLGDKILVEVERVDRFKRQIDFGVVADAKTTAQRLAQQRPVTPPPKTAKTAKKKPAGNRKTPLTAPIEPPAKPLPPVPVAAPEPPAETTRQPKTKSAKSAKPAKNSRKPAKSPLGTPTSPPEPTPPQTASPEQPTPKARPSRERATISGAPPAGQSIRAPRPPRRSASSPSGPGPSSPRPRRRR